MELLQSGAKPLIWFNSQISSTLYYPPLFSYTGLSNSSMAHPEHQFTLHYVAIYTYKMGKHFSSKTHLHSRANSLGPDDTIWYQGSSSHNFMYGTKPFHELILTSHQLNPWNTFNNISFKIWKLSFKEIHFEDGVCNNSAFFSWSHQDTHHMCRESRGHMFGNIIQLIIPTSCRQCCCKTNLTIPAFL